MASRGHPKLAQVGAPAPEFRLARLEGGEATLSDLLAGGPVLLAFFKASCPVCQFTLPYLGRIHTPGRLAVYAISQDGAAGTRDFARSFGVALPMLLDSEEAGYPASNAYGISSVPTLFLVETDGTLSRVVEGWSRADIDWLGHHAGVTAVRAGERVPEWKPG